MRILTAFFAVLMIATAAYSQFPPGEPFDECGLFEFVDVEGGCYRLVVPSKATYEIYGDFSGYTAGDMVRVFGSYYSGTSVCMVGNCCVTVDSVKSCTELPPPIPSLTTIGLIIMALALAAYQVRVIRRRRCAA